MDNIFRLIQEILDSEIYNVTKAARKVKNYIPLFQHFTNQAPSGYDSTSYNIGKKEIISGTNFNPNQNEFANADQVKKHELGHFFTINSDNSNRNSSGSKLKREIAANLAAFPSRLQDPNITPEQARLNKLIRLRHFRNAGYLFPYIREKHTENLKNDYDKFGRKLAIAKLIPFLRKPIISNIEKSVNSDNLMSRFNQRYLGRESVIKKVYDLPTFKSSLANIFQGKRITPNIR
jgi:hypothetical protein